MFLASSPKAFRAFTLFCLPLLAAFFFQSCQKKAEPERVRIGVFQSMSGPEASFGQDAMKGIRMAEEEINRNGGLLGHPVELLVRDNQSKAGETSSIARELVSRNHVVALIGEVASGRTLEAAPVAQRAGIPLVVNTATNDKITKAGNYVFQINYRDSQAGTVVARYMRSLGKARAGLLVDTSKDASTTVAKNFKKQFTALGGKIVAEQSFSGGDREFLAQLTAIQNTSPDSLVILGYYTDCAIILRQAKSLGKIAIFGSDGWDSQDLVRIARDAAEGAIFPSSFSAEDPAPVVQTFVEKYKKKYGEMPMAFTANGYDALMLLADAIKRAGSAKPRAIREALAATRDYPGVTGNITFNQDRDPSKSIVLLRVQNGKFNFVRREMP